MALRLSTGFRNAFLQEGSLRDMLQNGVLRIYSGTQPASSDDAPTGTLLATITAAAGTHTAEVISTGTVTLATGASGSVDTVTVDGVNIIDNAVAFNTSLTQTATDLAEEINKSLSSPDYRADSSGAVVTIYARRGAGASPNTFVVTATLTTITATYGNMAGGVAPVNGLRFGVSTGGVITKDTDQTWSGNAVAGGTAGWFRYSGSVADSLAADAVASEIRIDGNIATSGAELNLPSTTVTNTANQQISSIQFSMPAS